ncbi:MAG: ImmA/IrrE family metallo-endopeptidase [Candidatus Nanopelagicales bacterium]
MVPANRQHEAARFLSEADLLLSPPEVEETWLRFVEETIEQLQHSKIHHTPLQTEWEAVASADDEVAAFCRTAAALGLDPYDLDEDLPDQILQLGESIPDSSLLEDLAASTKLTDIDLAGRWVREALGRLESASGPPTPRIGFEPLPTGRWERPWELGYARARVPPELGVLPDQGLDIEALLGVKATQLPAPDSVVGFKRREGNVVVPQATAHVARRFTAARALGRRTFDDRRGGLLLTQRHGDYAGKMERAFAAELLAPAEGIDMRLGDDESDEAVTAVAAGFDVSVFVIVHQMDNQRREW